MKTKGIILAGGFGTRLQPMTKVTNKHLIPIYDKPMIYYPLQTLINAGIKDIMIVTGSEFAGHFINLLRNGEEFGVNLTFKIQSGAGGIAEALGLCKDFVGSNPMVVILGDNVFEDNISQYVKEYEENHNNAVVFVKGVKDPKRFGVATIKDGYIEKIVEKPVDPETNLAVTGLYFYNAGVWHIIDQLEPSKRGEMEITDVNNWFIKHSGMKYHRIKGFWQDCGTPEGLYRATTFIRKKDLCLE